MHSLVRLGLHSNTLGSPHAYFFKYCSVVFVAIATIKGGKGDSNL